MTKKTHAKKVFSNEVLKQMLFQSKTILKAMMCFRSVTVLKEEKKKVAPPFSHSFFCVLKQEEILFQGASHASEKHCGIIMVIRNCLALRGSIHNFVPV